MQLVQVEYIDSQVYPKKSMLNILKIRRPHYHNFSSGAPEDILRKDSNMEILLCNQSF